MRTKLFLALGLAAVLAMPALAQRDDKDLPPPPARHFVDKVGLVRDGEAQQFADALYDF